MAAILAGARKYRLGLTLAHHELQQLWDRDRDVASSVITHPATRICFRLGDFDAKKLEDGFSFFRSEDLQNLGVGEALCRIERAEYDFNLRTLSLPEVKSNVATSTRESLILRSREKYARRREEVEAEWLREDSVTERAVPTEGQREEQRKKSRPYTEGNPREEAVKPSLRTLKDETIRTGTTDGTDQKTKARPSQPYPPGRGGQQHKYLQNLFKRMGEDRGYRATIEKEILGGIGKVDVALERAGQSIACEISITTDPKQEVANIQKCVAGGFEQVIFVSADKKMLDKVKTLASAALVEQDWARVHCLAPDKVDSFLDQIEAQAAATEQTIRGYKVKTNYTTISEAEKKTRKKIIAETIVKALKKMKT